MTISEAVFVHILENHQYFYKYRMEGRVVVEVVLVYARTVNHVWPDLTGATLSGWQVCCISSVLLSFLGVFPCLQVLSLVLGFSAWLIRRCSCALVVRCVLTWDEKWKLAKVGHPCFLPCPPLCSLFMFRSWCWNLMSNSLNHGPLILWDPFTFNW